MNSYEFSMPWPPTVNHYHQPVKMGRGVRIIKGKKAKAYAVDAVCELVELGLSGEKLGGRLSVSLTLRPPTLAKYDVDNRPKGVLDALTEAEFWLDDEQVDSLKVVKGEKVKGGRVDLVVSVNE